jgi:hypothetical protein
MSFNLPGGVNPFEAPLAGIGEEARYGDLADNNAELIRREHIGRETNIKSLGHLAYLGAFFGTLGTIILALLAVGVIPSNGDQQNQLDPATQKLVFGGLAVFYFAISTLYWALGYGLTHLQVWARWTLVVLISIGLVASLVQTVFLLMVNPIVAAIALLVGGGIYGGILWLLLSSKAGVVFSREYKEVILKTPHVKPTTSLIVKILLILILVVVVGAVLAWIFAPRNG